MAKPSEKICNFKVAQGIKLKQSIDSLSDIEFNPEGLGRVDITEKGFEITVINPVSKVAGYLFLKSSGLINFHCSKPLVNKIINLNHTSFLFNDSTVDDTITIFHLDGSTNLSFIFGSAPNTEMKIQFLKINFEIGKFPDVIFFCEAVFTSDILREMIQRLEETKKSQLVSVDITERLVSVFIGESNPWIYKYDNDKVIGTRGMEPGQKHHAWFIMRHLEAIKKASYLAPCLLLCLLTEPEGQVMLRFNLRELGDLVFTTKAANLIPNIDGFLDTLAEEVAAVQSDK